MIIPGQFWSWRKYADAIGQRAGNAAANPSTFWGYPLSELQRKRLFALHAVKVYDNVRRTDFTRVEAGQSLGEVLKWNSAAKMLEVQRAPGAPQFIDPLEIVPDRKKMSAEGVQIPRNPVQWAQDVVGNIGSGIESLTEGVEEAGKIPTDIARTIRALIYIVGALIVAYGIIYLMKFKNEK